jgi:hypothetical protein
MTPRAPIFRSLLALASICCASPIDPRRSTRSSWRPIASTSGRLRGLAHVDRPSRPTLRLGPNTRPCSIYSRASVRSGRARSSSAKHRYAAVIATAPRKVQAYEAALRLASRAIPEGGNDAARS